MKNDIKSFSEDLSNTFSIPKPKIEDLINIHHIQPSDVVMTLQVAEQTQQQLKLLPLIMTKTKVKVGA